MSLPVRLPFRIRQSTLETARCLYRFHAHHIQGIPDPSGEYAGRGQDFHILSKKYVDWLRASGQSQDWDYANGLVQTQRVESQEAIDLFIGWKSRRTFEPERIFATEYEIRLGPDLKPNEAEPMYTADLDLVEMADDEAEITDYKTHFAVFEPTTIQASYYPWLLWQLFPHLKAVRFTLDFVRWGVQRTREFTRDDLQRLDRYVENQVARLARASHEDEWPASINSKCVYCRLDCPLVAGGMARSNIGQVRSLGEAQGMAQQLFALQRAARQITTVLKAYATEYGDIPAGNDMRLGFKKREHIEYDPQTIVALNNEHGFKELRTLEVASSEVRKIGRDYPEYVSRAAKRARDGSSTVFQFSNDSGDPLDEEDDID